jgi:GH24 family phage-related lysozyme (muramidase)
MTTEIFGRGPSLAVDYDVALEIASHEAIVRQAYKDSVGRWTWSVGLTSATGHDVERYIGKPQTLEKCLAVYAWALENYAEEVREAFAGYSLTKAQFAAALSFHWNTGAIRRASWVKLWKAGDIAGAGKAFMEWNKPAEIIPRRQKECDLFFDGKWSNNGTMIEYTRLTSKSTPVWSSAKRINVEKELRAAFALPPAPAPVPNPAPLPPPPDIEPAPVPVSQPATSGGLFAALKDLLEALFGKKA